MCSHKLADERGNAIIQFLAAVMFLVVFLFGSIQLCGTMFTMNSVASEITRACYQADTAGLTLAGNKNTFLKNAIATETSQLSTDRLVVTNAKATTKSVEESAPRGGELATLTSKTDQTIIEFDVSYNVPFAIDLPGLNDQVLKRHISFVRIDERTIELSTSTM